MPLRLAAIAAAGFFFFQMTLFEIVQEVGELSLKSPATEMNVRSYVNRAIRAIAQRANWSFMHDIQQVTLPANNTSVTMPSNFKELSREDSPISFTYGLYRLPVTVTTRSRIESAGLWPLMNGPLSMPLPGGYLPVRVVFMERNGPGGAWTLNVPPQFIITQAMVFNVQGYFFPPELQSMTDSNAFTNQGELVEAVIARAKAIGYYAEDPSSKLGQAAMQQFEFHFQNALYGDVQQTYQFSGLRM